MDWRKAKKLVILLLVVLNATLAFLNYKKQQDNVLTSVQEKAIYQVLSKNGISLYTDLLTKFPPMRKLSLKIPSYSRDDLKRLFFPEDETTVTVEFDKIIIKCETKTLTMRGNRGTLLFKDGTGKIEALTQERARREAEEFMSDLDLPSNDFHMGTIAETEDGFAVTFFDQWKGWTVFASYYTIYVTEKGIAKVDLTYFQPDGFTGEKKEICFSDEALLTFLKEIRQKNLQGTITVTRMELGYDFQDYGYGGERSESVEKLVPCYRIYIMGEAEPYIINAYTNELVTGQESDKKNRKVFDE